MDIRKELEAAVAAYDAKDLKGAHAKAMAIIEAFPDTAAAYQILSRVLRQSGNMNGAFEAIKKALELEPKNAEYHNSLGTFYRMVSRHDLALPSFRTAVDLSLIHI